MFKKIFLILFSISSIYAVSIDTKYDVRFGLFGRVGEVKATLDKNATNYKIKMVAKSKGLAKWISGGRAETYESMGKIDENGNFLPLQYSSTKKDKKRHYTKIYFFEYDIQTISMLRIDHKTGTKTKKKLDYFAKNDILTLFFNAGKYIQKNKNRSKFSFKVASSKNENKEVEIAIPKGKKLARAKKLLKTNIDNILLVNINQKIFSSSKGELIIVLAKDGLCQKATLKDVSFFGDIRGIRK
jgi:hypothetical protein